MFWIQSPKYLWDDCLELTALIHSNMALDIYDLGSEIPKKNLKERPLTSVPLPSFLGTTVDVS